MDREEYGKDEVPLRFTFVAMLFALTIGKIADQCSRLGHAPTYCTELDSAP